MKRLILILLVSFIIPQSFAKNIQAYLSYCTFSSPTDGPYLETYLSVYANSVQFKPTSEGKYQGSVGITMIFKQGETVKNFKKYELKSPLLNDTANLDFSFIDQQRILLPNGDYTFELQIRDLQDETPPLTDYVSLRIDYPSDKVSVSGIQLLENFKKTETPGILSKSGYDMVPFIHNFFPQSIHKITFYSEIYNTDKILGADSKYLLSCCIQSKETGKALNDLIKNRKETAKQVCILFNEFDISNLPSGNYNLVVEVRNQKNEIIASNLVFFQRSNPDVKLEVKDIAALNIRGSFAERITNIDTLRENIKSLEPISTETEKIFAEAQLGKADLLTMQQYFLNFWQRRDELTPERSWLQYDEQVKAVSKEYRTPIKKGYETDRGRTYLKYGPPNTITDQPFEASTLGTVIDNGDNYGYNPPTVPYQIWHYYQLPNNERDIKFVFVNAHLAENDYTLIHSNASGEVNNPNWQAELQRQIGIEDRDNVAPHGRYKGKSGILYNDPK
jgi:GWxTD domain-containing protein